MDNHAGVLQVQHSDRKFGGFRRLKWINPETYKEDGVDIKWIWEHASTQDYAFDDFSRNQVTWFLAHLADISGRVRFFLIDQAGLFLVDGNLVKGGSANIHFIVWDRNYSLAVDKEPAYELVDWLFYEVGVHRISGPIPDYNRLAPRFAYSMGMKYEGELQEAILWHGKYYNVKMFGLLEPWYAKRRGWLIQ